MLRARDQHKLICAVLACSVVNTDAHRTAESRASFAGHFKRNNMELQFWGYEISNVLATIEGAGGFYVFYQVLQPVFSNDDSGAYSGVEKLLALYPNATVTLSLGAIVSIVPTLRARFLSKAHLQWLNAVDLITTFQVILQAPDALILGTSKAIQSILVDHSYFTTVFTTWRFLWRT